MKTAIRDMNNSNEEECTGVDLGNQPVGFRNLFRNTYPLIKTRECYCDKKMSGADK